MTPWAPQFAGVPERRRRDVQLPPEQPTWLTGISYTGTNGSIYDVSYPSFDKVGNRTAKTENTAAITYAYDLVYRLLNVSGAATETFTYDDAGNRLTDAARLYSIGAANTLLAAGSTGYGYDDFGNTVTAGAWTYGWNSAGQMVSASNGTTTATYAYDPFGRRISKTVDGVTTSFLYDGENIVASITGGAVTHYVQGPGADEHLAMVRGGATYFYHVDGLGSTTAITDATQNIVQSYSSYAAFGAPAASTAFDQPYQFTGREFDLETGLNYHRARYLDLGTGRWLSRDPLGFAAGDVVLTNYVGGNPGNLTDPNGMDAVSATLGIVGFGAGLVSLYPPAAPIARPVGFLASGLGAMYSGYQINKTGKLDFGHVSGFALATIDIAILTAEHRFPLSSVILGSISKPLNNATTIHDAVTTFLPRQDHSCK